MIQGKTLTHHKTKKTVGKGEVNLSLKSVTPTKVQNLQQTTPTSVRWLWDALSPLVIKV